MKNKFYDYFQIKIVISYFIILIPILLISGPFLTDLAISTVAISYIFIKKKKKFISNYFFIIFTIFCFLLIVSSALSENKYLSLKSSLFYFRFGLFTLFFWYVIEFNNKILKKIFYIILFSFSLIIFDSIYQYIFGTNILNMKIVNHSRISSFFGDELKMGGYLMRLSPLLLALFFLFYDRDKYKKFLPLVILFILLIEITIYLSGERTSFILFNFFIILLIIFINNFKILKLSVFVCSLFLVLILLNLNTPFKKRLIDRTLNHTKIFDKNSKIIIFSKKYNEHYISSFRMFMDHKLIGIGPKNFRELCKKREYNLSPSTCSTHPHNILLQFLSETGLLGFLFYFILNIFLWSLLIKNLYYKYIFKRTILNNSEICLILYFLVIMWPIAPFGNFFNNWLSAVVYYPAGILLWMFRNNKKMYIKQEYLILIKKLFYKMI